MAFLFAQMKGINHPRKQISVLYILSTRFSTQQSADTHKIPSKSHKPSGPPALQSTSDLTEAGLSTNTQAKTKVVKTKCFKS
jgi:hypothetical protein